MVKLADHAWTLGDAMSNSSLATADRSTHLKIVVVALIASLTVMIVGITARPQVEAGAAAQVVRAGLSLLATATATTAVR